MKQTKIIDYLKEYLPEYDFRQGTTENLEDQYKLKQSNADFFEKVQNHPVTIEECRADLTACPPDFLQGQRYYWLVYEKETCIAILAYLEGYPDTETVYIGLLMVDAARQGEGIGRKINAAFMRAASKCDYRKIRLGCYRTNESGYWFWRKNRYVAEKMTETETDGKTYQLLHMICDISDPHMFETEAERKTIYRSETEADYHSAEEMTQRAFWNKYHQGCNEHYLLHVLRKDEAYVPEVSLVAEVDGKIVGGIWYSKSQVKTAEKEYEILTFGPLCVAPEYQGCGIGGQLLEKSMRFAAKAGYDGIIIFGEPGYYPKHGFKTCDKFSITTADGQNFDAFMGIELTEGAFEKMRGGRFFEAEVFETLKWEDAEEYNKSFPHMEKIKLPGQWE